MPASSAPTATAWLEERHRFIEAGGNTTHAFGLGHMLGRSYALLYLTPRSLSLEQIAAELGVSKASASVALRQLAELRAARQIWIPGDRRDFYEAETDFRVILREGLLPGVRKKLHSAGGQIERTLAAGEDGAFAAPARPLADPAEPDGGGPLSRSDAAELRRRLRAARSLHQRLDRLLASPFLAPLLEKAAPRR
jgi:hypothetical protein